ncbi:hypothetical protein [Mycobacterium sp. E2733]|uniref:hypothetical protein n=1 Tax=Mycobacterium sp. E2733 TaxID=1834138 RepID=UPI0007FCED03|nr:hypothetical protein [Mycobacterium sp. E2733]OBH93152.1 hypothetical protein A5678_05780 [Mycobacterium sp. E2733]
MATAQQAMGAITYFLMGVPFVFTPWSPLTAMSRNRLCLTVGLLVDHVQQTPVGIQFRYRARRLRHEERR